MRCASAASQRSPGEILSGDSTGDYLQSKSRLGLGSTDNENIALRRNHREMELLLRKQKMLGLEQEYVVKMIELNSKSAQVRYKRLTKRVSRIRSHLNEEEMKEMENDVMKQEFANKYRNILRDQQSTPCGPQMNNTNDLSTAPLATNDDGDRPANGSDASLMSDNSLGLTAKRRPHTQFDARDREMSADKSARPETCPNKRGKQAEEKNAVEDIIPSLEGLLDQLHNIKPHQFYENQRKLKLYDIQLSLEEFEGKKKTLYKGVDAIVNWDKKKEEKEEEEEKKTEEEENQKPQKRKTTFMRSVLRNFSMELMMKTMQYGWADLGKCRYLRNRGGDDDNECETMPPTTENSLKLQLPTAEPVETEEPTQPRRDPGFGPDGKMIRTADLLGLKY